MKFPILKGWAYLLKAPRFPGSTVNPVNVFDLHNFYELVTYQLSTYIMKWSSVDVPKRFLSLALPKTTLLRGSDTYINLHCLPACIFGANYTNGRVFFSLFLVCKLGWFLQIEDLSVAITVILATKYCIKYSNQTQVFEPDKYLKYPLHFHSRVFFKYVGHTFCLYFA